MRPPAHPVAHPPSAAAVWAPWLAAPLFALLPVGGCGVAGGLRPAAAHPAATASPGPQAPIVTVVTVANRHVARDPAVH